MGAPTERPATPRQMNAVCHHCMDLITRFGGIWFVRGGGAVCRRSPDTQHRPIGRLLDVPPPKQPSPVQRAACAAGHPRNERSAR